VCIQSLFIWSCYHIRISPHFLGHTLTLDSLIFILWQSSCGKATI